MLFSEYTLYRQYRWYGTELVQVQLYTDQLINY